MVNGIQRRLARISLEGWRISNWLSEIIACEEVLLEAFKICGSLGIGMDE